MNADPGGSGSDSTIQSAVSQPVPLTLNLTIATAFLPSSCTALPFSWCISQVPSLANYVSGITFSNISHLLFLYLWTALLVRFAGGISSYCKRLQVVSVADFFLFLMSKHYDFLFRGILHFEHQQHVFSSVGRYRSVTLLKQCVR